MVIYYALIILCECYNDHAQVIYLLLLHAISVHQIWAGINDNNC